MLRFLIISHNFKKLNNVFKGHIIINDDFRNIKTIELSIGKYSQISIYMNHRSIPSCGAAALPQCGRAVNPQKSKPANL